MGNKKNNNIYSCTMKSLCRAACAAALLLLLNGPALFSPPETAAACSCCPADQACSCCCGKAEKASPAVMDFIMPHDDCTCTVNRSGSREIALPEYSLAPKKTIPILFQTKQSDQRLSRQRVQSVLTKNSIHPPPAPLFLLKSSFLL